jgi:hypothetical protein
VATARYTIKQFDLEPPFEIRLLDGIIPVDLTNATQVLFIMKNRKGLKVLGQMIKADQTGENRGIVLYRWLDGDTNTAGSFNAEVQVSWPTARAQTFPANQYVLVNIQKDLNQAGATLERHYGTFALTGGAQLLPPLGRAFSGTFLISSGESALTKIIGTIGIVASDTYTHTQTIPAITWTVVHNLNRPVAVSVTDPFGVVVAADVTYVSLNEVLIEFTEPFAGIAYFT